MWSTVSIAGSVYPYGTHAVLQAPPYPIPHLSLPCVVIYARRAFAQSCTALSIGRRPRSAFLLQLLVVPVARRRPRGVVAVPNFFAKRQREAQFLPLAASVGGGRSGFIGRRTRNRWPW